MTKYSLPTATFPGCFLLSFSEAHWRNGQEILKQINKVGRGWVQEDQKVCLFCDAFKGHFKETVKLNLEHTLHKKWSFPLRISSVKVTISAVSCRFGHIYWRNPKWKTSFFVQWHNHQSGICTKNHDTHLQLLDVTTNLTVKKVKQQEFSNHFTTCITEVFQNDPNKDVTNAKVDLKLCNLKQRYANLIVIL